MRRSRERGATVFREPLQMKAACLALSVAAFWSA